MSVVIGWDVGGAHLKAARAEGGRIVAAIQIASPLWLGVSRLDEAFRTARSELGSADAHAATMTGELSMAFTSRSEGVAALAALTASALGPAPVRFYAGRAGFLSLDAVGAHASDVASANWHASAALIARYCREALLIDMGSTTTDIIPIVAGAVAARGYTDAERLTTGELAYAGLVRSLAFASANRAPFHLKRGSHLASRHPLVFQKPGEAITLRREGSARADHANASRFESWGRSAAWILTDSSSPMDGAFCRFIFPLGLSQRSFARRDCRNFPTLSRRCVGRSTLRSRHVP